MPGKKRRARSSMRTSPSALQSSPPGSKATVITDVIDIKGAELNAHLGQIETDSFNFEALNKFGNELGPLVLPRWCARSSPA